MISKNMVGTEVLCQIKDANSYDLLSVASGQKFHESMAYDLCIYTINNKAANGLLCQIRDANNYDLLSVSTQEKLGEQLSYKNCIRALKANLK